MNEQMNKASTIIHQLLPPSLPQNTHKDKHTAAQPSSVQGFISIDTHTHTHTHNFLSYRERV